VSNGLTNLHCLFSQAPELGSLIDPAQLGAGGELFSADWETLQPFLAAAMSTEKDDDTHERAVAAQGMAKAAEILSGEYTLVITNVPYLGNRKQAQILRAFCESTFPRSKQDLATVFVERSLRFVGDRGTVATVTPQYWLFLSSYKPIREFLLQRSQICFVGKLGPGAFETIGGEVVNAALFCCQSQKPTAAHHFLRLMRRTRRTQQRRPLSCVTEPLFIFRKEASLRTQTFALRSRVLAKATCWPPT